MASVCLSALLPTCGVGRFSTVFQSFVRAFHRRKRVPTRRRVDGVGVYAEQISNFDEIDLPYLPVAVPDIPLTPEGTDYKPSKLLMVWRTKELKGRPYFEKDIIRSIGLDGFMDSILPAKEILNHCLHVTFANLDLFLNGKWQRSDIAILKNSPKSNMMLYYVKHLVRIKPITFPDGIPTEEDIGNTILMPDGRLVIRKSLRMTPEELLKEQLADPKKMDGDTLSKHLRLRWIGEYDV